MEAQDTPKRPEWLYPQDFPGLAKEGAPHTVRVVPWTWRDGSVHLEVSTATFHDDDGVFRTHLRGAGAQFVTACGAGWWGRGSASGLGHSQKIDCEACREILRNATFVT